MSDNNGWPGKPGVPLNPEQDSEGYVWRVDGVMDIHKWVAKNQWYENQRGFWVTPDQLMADGDTYLGRIVTPDEMDARVKDARLDALEEAAKWHDEQVRFWMEKGREVSALETQLGLNLLAKSVEHLKHAAAIRALSDTPPDMVLVPREPTSKMHDAGFAVSVGGLLGEPMGYDFCTANRRIWIAMVEAAEKGEGDE